MKFGDKVRIHDGSQLEGVDGIVYKIEDDKAVVLLDREVLWPVLVKDLALLE